MWKLNFFILFLALMYLSGCSESRLNQRKKHFLHLGNLSFKEKMYQDAIRYYREAIQVDSSFAQAYNNLGIVYFKTGKTKEAMDAYNACLLSDSLFLEAYYNRSNANYELGNLGAMLQDLNKIKNTYEPIKDILFSKGLAFYGLKDYDSADYVFSKALKLDSTNVELFINLATTKFYKKQYKEAEDLVLKSQLIDAKTPAAYNLLGMIFVEKGLLQDALEQYNAGLKLEQNNAFMLNNRGFVYLEMDDFDQALQDINASIVINPENPWAYRNKGIYYFKKGKSDDAERLLKQSITLDKSILLSHLYLGELFQQKGDKIHACEAFKTSMELGELKGEKAYQHYCQ